jgi:hypothetical protein
MGLLTLAYGLAGIGYIITATFLPVIAHQALAGSHWLDLAAVLCHGHARGVSASSYLHRPAGGSAKRTRLPDRGLACLATWSS